MKKIVFILVLLLFTAPAWATTVIIDANQVVPGSNEVVITYEVVLPDVNLPRAFGLDITVTEGNIVDCIPYMEGECTDSDKGFGIFPGSIVIDAAPPIPQIIDYGNPAALAGAIGTPLGSGIDTNCITIELGSLYVDGNAPPSSGVLCTIVITKSCIVRIKGNAARCGESSPAIGVVMEDQEEIPIVTFGDANVTYDPEPPDCFPSDNPAYDDWVAVGKPDCWCASKGYPRQCHGDVDGLAEGKGNYWVFSKDLTLLIAAWAKPIESLTGNEICADSGHDAEGKGLYRVFLSDLNILIANWATNTVDADCP